MSEKITFKELVEKISAKTDQSEQTTDQFIHQLADIIERSLGSGEKISISGFGKFELRWMDERKGRNPQTGEEITIPGQNKVVFKPYKNLRESVNKPYKHLEPVVLKDTTESDDNNDENSIETAAISAATEIFQTRKQADEEPGKEESVDDLLEEKPSPVDSKIPINTPKDDEANVTDPFLELDDWEELKTVDRQKLSKEIQDNGRFRWSYTAASIVVLLAIILLVFTYYRAFEEPDASVSQNNFPENVPVVENSIDEPVSTYEASDAELPDEADACDYEEASVSGSEPEYTFTTHEISSGESLWTIAEREYGNAYLWPVIYSENRDEIENPNQIAEGSAVQLPSFKDTENLSPDEQDRVARGYLSVYDWVIENQPDSARYYLWAAGSFSRDILQDASDRVNEADLAFATQR